MSAEPGDANGEPAGARSEDVLVLAGGVLLCGEMKQAVSDGVSRRFGDETVRIVALDRDPVEGGVEMGRLFLSGALPCFRNPWE